MGAPQMPAAEPDAPLSAEEVVRRLGLAPHPEGGHFRETWRDQPAAGVRGTGTAIYSLLRRGERSHWHRIDGREIWHFYAGAPLLLTVSGDGDSVTSHRLGNDLRASEVPQLSVPPGAWQGARSLGDWTLVGCTVSPAFAFAGFELAPPGWRPR